MASLAAAQSVVAGQQAYAKQHDLASLFEALTVLILSNKPTNVLSFVSTCLTEAKGGELKVPATGKGIDTEEGAAAYMESNGVHVLLEELLTMVLVAKPPSPTAYLATQVQSRVDVLAKGQQVPTFYTDDDLKGVFSLFDATHSNVISADQARAALKSLGADAAGVPATGMLDIPTFIKIGREALEKGRK